MTKLRVHSFAISLDGYGAGPAQSEQLPMGIGGGGLHEWGFATPTLRRMLGMDVGDAKPGPDDDYIARGFDGIGATIMGRNMFGPDRGPWSDDPWQGWWGDEPPFHHPVFVLTHHDRPPLERGETTFHFVTDGVEAAHERAVDAAGDADIRLGGGASTIDTFLRAGLVDELHVAIVPFFLGGGSRLFDDVGTLDDLTTTSLETTDAVTHVVLSRTP